MILWLGKKREISREVFVYLQRFNPKEAILGAGKLLGPF
jgi:hypothetical protein